MQILLQIHGMIGYWSKNDQFCYVSWKVFLSLKSRLLTRTWDRDHSQNGYCCVRNSGYTPGLFKAQVYKANLRNPIQGADQVTSEVQRTVKFLSSGKKKPTWGVALQLFAINREIAQKNLGVSDRFSGWDVTGFVPHASCVLGTIGNWRSLEFFLLKGWWFFENDYKNYGISTVVLVSLDFMPCDSIPGKFCYVPE